MNELINKITTFLSQHNQNVVTVSQGKNKLSKNTQPKYAFTLTDITTLFGNVEVFLKSIPQKGFTDGTTIALRKMYTDTNGEISYRKFEDFTLNFSKTSEITENNMNTQPMVQPMETMPVVQPTAAYHPQTMLSVPALGFAQIPQMELTRYEVIKERFDDLKKENSKLEEELKDAKSEIRQLKDENFSLRLKIDTAEEKHAVDLKRQELDKKSFWEGETGGNIINALGAMLPTVAEKMMTTSTVPALAMPSTSPAKQAFIDIIMNPQVTDEQVSVWYRQLFGTNE